MTRLSLAFASAACLAFAIPAARAASTVPVELQDPTTNDTVTTMKIKASPSDTQKGRITFNIKNESKTMVYELLMVKEAKPSFVYDAKQDRVVEDHFTKLIDTDDIQPGKSIKKIVTLKPGTYELLCNQPTHFKAGISATFTVHG